MKSVGFRKTAAYLISAAGIIIGIAVATVVLGIYEGGSRVLDNSFWSSGVKIYDIELDDKTLAADGYLTLEDGSLITERMPEAKGSIPVLRLSAQLLSYKAEASAEVMAVNQMYRDYANLEMIKGNFINEQDVSHADKIAVVDDYTALELFGTTDVIGQQLDLQVNGKKVPFTVSGVFRNFNKNVEALFDDEYPGICFIPESVPEDVSFGYSVEKIIALVDRKLHSEEASVKLSHLLEKEHDAAEVYSVNEYKQLAEVSKFIDKYLVFAVIIAIVGLLSGGIGVMNAMLLTMQEQKKEIGLYKLYGSDIKELQYDILFRTLVVCIGCGLLGMIAGLMIGSFIGSFINIDMRITLMSIFFAVPVSGTVGVFSSIYPASRIKLADVSAVIWGE